MSTTENNQSAPKIWDPWTGDGSFESEDGEWLAIPGHVPEAEAIASMRHHIKREPFDNEGDAELFVTYAYALSVENGEWFWFHEEPHPESEPYTFVTIDGGMRLAKTAQDTLVGAETNKRANKLEREKQALTLWGLHMEYQLKELEKLLARAPWRTR